MYERQGPQESHRLPYLHLALALLLLALCSTQLGCSPGACYYCGSYYQIGESFKTFDKCNTCTCEADPETGGGRVQCSKANTCAGYCYWDEKKYSSEETLLLRGSCARCNCKPGHVIRQKECGGINLCLSIEWCEP